MIWLFAAVYASGEGSNKIKRHLKGLNIAASMPRWGQLWTRYRDQKSNCHFWRAGNKSGVLRAKARYCPVPPALNTLGAWANHLSQCPSGPQDSHLPSPHLRNQSAPPWGASKGTCYLFSLLPCGPRSSNQALPEFLDWSLTNWLGKGQEPWLLTPGGISFWINLFHQRKHRGELVPGFLHGAQAIQNCRKCFSPTLGPVQATCPGKLCDTRVPCSCCERVLKSLFRIRCMAQETQTGALD